MRPPLEVTINGPRGDEWERVCGTRVFPVASFQPIKANLPGKPNADVWLLNLRLIDSPTLQRIIEHFSVKFNTPPNETAAAAAAQGIPILAEDCTVVLNDPQRWLL